MIGVCPPDNQEIKLGSLQDIDISQHKQKSFFLSFYSSQCVLLVAMRVRICSDVIKGSLTIHRRCDYLGGTSLVCTFVFIAITSDVHLKVNN